MSDQTPLLSLPLLMPSQAQKHLTHNEALLALDALVQLSARRRASEAPLQPADGERFLVADAPSGAFAGQAARIALWSADRWQFFVPRPGWILWLESDAVPLVFDGTAWRELKTRRTDRMGVGADSDAVNRLAVSSPAVLFDHAGGGTQVKVNKAASGETASLLFQAAYSGRAELGLSGDDTFRIKTSADGALWRVAIAVDPASGDCGIGTPTPRARLDVAGAIACGVYTLAALPPASRGAGQIVMVSDEAGGAVLAFSDGANWRRVTDRAVAK